MTTDLESQITGGEAELPPEAPIEDLPEGELFPEGGELDDPPAYEPNFNFRVKDSEETFPEEFRQYVTDKETEDRFRDLFERAYGVEPLKEDRTVLREHNQTLYSNLNQYADNYKLLGQMVKNNDLDNFHKQWGITEEQVIDHVMNKVRMNDPELPPEQRQQYVEQQNMRSLNAQLQYQNQQLMQQQQQSAMMQRQQQLDIALAQPDVARQANEYDSRVGKPGSFRDQVIRVGQYHGYQGRDIPADQAIQEFQQMIGLPTAIGGQQVQSPQQPAPQAPVQQVATKPVIPVTRGGGSQSPAAVVPKSIADLRKLGNEMNS